MKTGFFRDHAFGPKVEIEFKAYFNLFSLSVISRLFLKNRIIWALLMSWANFQFWLLGPHKRVKI